VNNEAPIELKLAVATGYLQVCGELTRLLDNIAADHHEMTAAQVISAVREWAEVTRKAVYATVKEQSPQEARE
jgi:hypothetical protein